MSKITVHANDILFPVAPDLYGLFFEDINRAGDGGLYPEMLRNRSFEDSILPERCEFLENQLDFITPAGWKDQFNNGEGLRRWLDGAPQTDIPAWYAKNAVCTLDRQNVLNPARKAALRAAFHPGGAIFNTGFRGVAVSEGASCSGWFFARTETPCTLTVQLAARDLNTIYASCDLVAGSPDYIKYEFTLTPDRDDPEAVFVISCDREAEVLFGYSSLMPADTFLGHGLRKDLAKLLKHTASRFLRFPGGCIVEGFTKETAMRFRNTIGPVWERPSHQLMWHYRTSNGLGFHEYLQLCEDLELEPVYVINCGMTCQGRKEELFEGEELNAWIREAVEAIEYATAPASTSAGALRAAAGHPAPFKMTYVEIGNENFGPEYFSRYALFYQALSSRFPDIRFIANTHVEQEGLAADIVDEHYYNTPEYFARQYHMYDNRERRGPKIFVGEYAVTNGSDVGNLRSAVAESMYLMGLERNQDLVALSAYAPLFSHVHYTSWTPNLILFDNHRSCGIPFFHALSMMASHRGKNVVRIRTEAPSDCEDLSGWIGVISSGSGVRLRNIRCNGAPVSPSHNIVSELREARGMYEAWENDNSELMQEPAFLTREVLEHVKTYVTFGDEPVKDFVYETELYIEDPQTIVSLAFWIRSNTMLHNQDETRSGESKLWKPVHNNRYAWTLANGTGVINSTVRSRYAWKGEPVDIPQLRYGKWMKMRIEATRERICCYIDGELVLQQDNVRYPLMAAAASTDEEHIILKVANIAGEEDPIDIQLDCDVREVYEAIVLSGNDPKAENTLEEPERIAPVTRNLHHAGRHFVYRAPAYSVSILTLKKA